MCYNTSVTPPFELVENPAAHVWDDFVSACGGHLLQSAAWGDLKSRFGWSALRLGLARNGTLVAGAQTLFRQLAPGLVLAYIPRGPVCAPGDSNLLTPLLDALCSAARARKALALKIEPDWQAGVSPDVLTLPGLRPSRPIQPQTTIHLDLARDLDLILGQMKTKWRYNIRLAERKGVGVRVGGPDDISLFYGLLQTTGQRDRFAIHSLDYYATALSFLGHDDHVRLWIAEYSGEPLAAIFVTAFGNEAIYLYGASGNTHRERMPNHALHWAAIQWAKARGCARYDFWGIPDVEAKQPSALPDGLYQFKQGFGGQVVRYIGAFEVPFSAPRYALYKTALALRRGGSDR